jgi:hypothetical protein
VILQTTTTQQSSLRLSRLIHLHISLKALRYHWSLLLHFLNHLTTRWHRISYRFNRVVGLLSLLRDHLQERNRFQTHSRNSGKSHRWITTAIPTVWRTCLSTRTHQARRISWSLAPFRDLLMSNTVLTWQCLISWMSHQCTCLKIQWWRATIRCQLLGRHRIIIRYHSRSLTKVTWMHRYTSNSYKALITSLSIQIQKKQNNLTFSTWLDQWVKINTIKT